MNPIFDPSKLTSDEISRKISKCLEYREYQYGLGHMSAVESINQTLMMLEEERDRRFNEALMTPPKEDRRKQSESKKEKDGTIIELGKLSNE